MTAAVDEFLSSLDSNQRAAVSFPVTSEVWRRWSNIHRNVMRHGLCFAELNERQRELAYNVMRTGLGARAYETARNAMRLNEHLAELTGLPDEFGEFFYWISIFGTPSANMPWGWQIDGHHCNINCFVLGDQVVLSPMLLGAEPVLAETGKYRGITVLREEEARGWEFMNALTPEQRGKATIGYDLPFDGYASGFKDNVVIPYDGLGISDMTRAQHTMLVDLIKLYADRLPPAHAKLRLDEAKRHLHETIFAWIGQFDFGRAVLLSDLQPGDLHRVLSPARRGAAGHRLQPAACACAGAHAKRQRLRQGAAAAVSIQTGLIAYRGAVWPPSVSAIQSVITSRVSATLSMPQCSAPPSASVCT